MRALLVSEGKHEEGGALETLVCRVATVPLELTFRRSNDSRIRTHRGKGAGMFKRALAWMREAQRKGCDAIILVIDEDGHRDRRGQFDEAQDSEYFSVKRALGIAVRTFDAWMIADEKALSTVIGANVDRQSDPERNTAPKETCAGILTAHDSPMSQTEFYAGLAEVIDIDLLEDRCPKGFAPFAARLRGLH